METTLIWSSVKRTSSSSASVGANPWSAVELQRRRPRPPRRGHLHTVGARETLKEITIQYEFFRRNLAAIGLAPVQIGVTPRRAWQVRADNGLTIELGREDIEPRLERFVGAYARTVGRLQRRIDHVDLRYSNGFAVRIHELRGEPRSAAKAGKKG